MHTFRFWKRYAEAVEKEFRVSDFSGGSFSVQRGSDNDEACTASWSWVKPVHFLAGPSEDQPGVTLSWSSRQGPSGGWSYTVVSESGRTDTGLLPVPMLAAPAAIVGLMPALWRGRHQLLRATDDLWERARETESAVETARLLSEDKYDLDYQLDEEEGETFDRWQAELEGAAPLEGHAPAARAEPETEPDSNLPQDGEEPTDLTRYRIVAQRTDPEHPGAAVVTNYAYGRSVEEAVTKARQALEKPDGLYGDQDMYRVVQVVEEGPAGEILRQEDARRTFVDLVMNAARAETSQDITGMPHPEMFGVLCDFFTRAIVFPGQFGFPSGSDPDDDQMHTSDPSRALSHLLLQHLTHHELDLVETTPSWPLLEDRHTADRGGDGQEEGSEAPPELIEQVLAICEPHYAAVTGTSPAQWDKELSRELVGLALRTVRLADREAYPQTLEAYLGKNRARLERLWRIYGPAGVFPRGVYHLVEAPAAFVLCERIDNAPMWLTGVWSSECESDTPLERLQKAWLYGTSDKDGR